MKIPKHWSVDTDELAKDPEAFAIWKIEQKVNWGIGEGRLRIAELKKYWNKIDIDPFKRRALELVVFPEKLSKNSENIEAENLARVFY